MVKKKICQRRQVAGRTGKHFSTNFSSIIFIYPLFFVDSMFSPSRGASLKNDMETTHFKQTPLHFLFDAHFNEATRTLISFKVFLAESNSYCILTPSLSNERYLGGTGPLVMSFRRRWRVCQFLGTGSFLTRGTNKHH